MLGSVLLVAVPPAQAVKLRIASFNVKTGFDTSSDRGTAEDTDYAPTVAILQRVQPDIVCFQELYGSETHMTAWLEAAAELGYPYYALSDGGTFDTSMRLGVWSKYPITSSAHVRETVVDPTAAEIMRWPLRVTIDVPGALYPFHVFTTHNKATTVGTKERMQRAFEIHRTVNYITNLVAQDTMENVEYAIMGDFNDDIGLSQTVEFSFDDYDYYRSSLGNSTISFKAGSDIPWYLPGNSSWPLPYRYFPTERLAMAGMTAVDAPHTGLALTWTHYAANPASRYRLDYILFSDEITSSAYGPPVAEVYNSEGDATAVGLPKYGEPLPTGTSATASDHRMLFADFYLIDEVAGVTPVGIISEVVDHPSADGSYVEICNTGSSGLDLTGYELEVYLNGSTNPTSIALSGMVAGGAAHLVAVSTNGCQTQWGVTPDQTAAIIGLLNGKDTVVLRKPGGILSDIYGEIGALPGAWDFTHAAAVRKAGVSDPLPYWSSAEWTISVGTATATPGIHQALSDADGYVADIGLDPPVPRATNLFAITASTFANQLASNLTATAWFRISGGAWLSQALTNAGTAWRTPLMSQAVAGGDVIEYYVELAFEGPGANSPRRSDTRVYTFPVTPGTAAPIKPLFNEVRADGAGVDSNEFVELIAPAGTNLVGYTMEHYSGNESVDGPLWTYTFPPFTVPDDGITDRATNHLGFVVISQTNAVANTDLLLPGLLGNGPNALILYDAATNIVDAVVWLSSSSDTFDTDVDDPGTVSRQVPSISPNYLHVIGIDPNTDSCPQAPNDVLSTTTGWVAKVATPGALNVGQTNGLLIVSRLDLDGDGIPDDEDNCPGVYNPTQSDMDHDGIGDACDPDIDGDGIPNELDNCPDDYNPDQTDTDGDGIGDACDPDIDGDGIPNEDDPFPYEPHTWVVDFEGASKGTYPYGVAEINGRSWGLDNALIGSLAGDLLNDTKSLRIKAPGELVLQGPLTNGIESLTFVYGPYVGDGETTITAEYNAGAGWVQITSVSTLGITSLTTNTTAVDVPGPVDFRLTCTGTTDNRANVDDIAITMYSLPSEPTDATCTLVATNQAVYNGLLHTNAFRVLPLGMPYTVAYTPRDPLDVGTYTATVTVPTIDLVTGGTFVFADSVIITEAPVGPPVAPGYVWVSLTNTTEFVATWSPVAGATSYQVDVGTRADFLPVGAATGNVYTVDFEDGAKSRYAAGDVTLNNLSWNLNEAVIGKLANDRFNGTQSARVRSNETANASGILAMNADLATGLSSVTLHHGSYGSDAPTTGRVDYSTDGGLSWLSAGTFEVASTSLTPFSVTNLNVEGSVRIRVVKTSGASDRFNIDDIALYPYSPATTPSYLAAYSNRPVNDTSLAVTGLNTNETYYFRVQAIAEGGTSPYSSVAAVTTPLDSPPGVVTFENWVAGKGQDPGHSNFLAEADSDGDGMTTWEEYLADTDPANSNSMLMLTGTYLPAEDIGQASGRLEVTFEASTGRYYQLLYSTNLLSPTITSNLGWGVPGRVITNEAGGTWVGTIRVRMTEP
ncbi:MAG: thrombospondin type 3 repeat-containing protein [Kiritimatiellae bacterium]|nr:thrombospondin type 3 repeat-containing protein [Kiritimatiellia bacterium]